MDTREVAPDIVVVRDRNERSVIVKGREYATAIDLPTQRAVLRQMIDAGRQMVDGGLGLAILTHQPDPKALPLDRWGVKRLYGPESEEDGRWHWDVVPGAAQRKGNIPVHLVRDEKVVYDDTGRSFHCEVCAGAVPSLAVRIEPENVLVIADDIHPELPSVVVPGCVLDTISRYESWNARRPEVLVPASGIPIAGDRITEVLGRQISYLKSLRERVDVQLTRGRIPWERLVHTVSWTDCWKDGHASSTLVSRHRYNVREMAADIWRTMFPDVEVTALAA